MSRAGRPVPLEYGRSRGRLRLVEIDEPLDLPEPSRDAMRGEVLVAALCFGGTLLVLAVQIVRGWLA